MFDYFLSLHPIMQAFIAGLFTWGCTIFGSSFVYFFKTVNRKLLDMMMGFAGGVMIAASFWSLLAPALEYAEADYGSLAWLPAAIGFLLGGFFIRLIDYVVPHLHLSKPIEEAEGMQPKKGLSKSMLLFLAITIHNIPEGSSLSLPIRGEGHSRWKAFWYGSMSAVVEPVAAVIGAAFVLSMTAILPYALAFAAGAMIFVVVEELIPESQSNGNTDIATLSLMAGFVVMMVLDVALG